VDKCARGKREHGGQICNKEVDHVYVTYKANETRCDERDSERE
jgi:hypothetical protein